MQCVENVADKATRRAFPAGTNIGRRISDACEAMGLMVRPMGHLNVMSPPLVITHAQVDRIADTLDKAIRQVTDRLVKDGVRLG